ncbi:Flp family type IVb pilin [Hyphomicrobium sp.]|jgi:pilus assembly protein Flp/PilA|uniref:Flp family type IVb pilin n=1 Tax=Hyphomicrobium sp. TaxID=82 RepID=UPI003567C363
MGTAMKETKLLDFLGDESGATSIEYALIAGIVSICMVVSLTQISSALQDSFNSIAQKLLGQE